VNDDLRLVVLPVVTGELRERAWEAYSDAFDELRAAAIQRHMMTRGEFDEVMADDRVHVYLAEHADGGIVGIATLTNDLAAIPLVSPDFFQARWPEHYAAGRCWYNGFVGVRPSAQGAGAFQLIVGTVAKTLARNGGVVVLDVPQRNIESFHVPHAVKRIADTVVSGVTCEMVDAQTYWAYTTPVPVEIDLREPQVVDVRERAGLNEATASRLPPTGR
jgi:GNAT superfamily N-acetyltransferase